jgi:RND family efflux transporter MFP subunit
MTETTPAAETERRGIAQWFSMLPRRRIWIGGAILVVLVGFVLWISGRGADVNSSHLPVVAVTRATRGSLKQTVTVLAEFRPYQKVSLHAKVAGYVQSIPVDVGDHVKEGQLIAQLDVPEIKNDLERDGAALEASRAEENRAQANYQEVHLASDRLQSVAAAHPKLVAQQDVDDAQAKDQSAAGALAAAKQHVDESTAELHKAQALFGYANIIAPFDGVITHRYADLGSLIQAGTASNTQAMPVVDLDENGLLRLTFPVPESAVAQIKVGAPVSVSVGALHETFKGAISRFADKVDRDTRTMSTEVDVENPDGRFMPGMYADVTLTVAERDNVVTVPVEAVSMSGHPSVLIVDGKGVVQRRPVTVGLQTSDRVEVQKGLLPGDTVIVGSRTGVQSGTKVTPKIIATTAAD